MIGLASESILGYGFWTLFHALGPMIWFYPLNELDITGYEIFVLVFFTPLLWLIPLVRQCLSGRMIQSLLMALMLLGIISFQAWSTIERLFLLSVGVGASFLVQCNSWWSKDPYQCRQSFWGYTIGFFSLLSSRVWYKSITPAWNDQYSNKFISTVFSIVAVSKFVNAYKDVMVEEWFQNKTVNAFKSKSSSSAKPKEIKKERSSTLCSLAYGSICFLMHTFLGEVSVLSRYTISGLSVSSPQPNPWGGGVLLAALFGFVLSTYSELPCNKLWLLSGVVSSMGLMFLPAWSAFTCGLFFVMYLVSVWPTVAENMINCKSPGKCLFLAHAVYLVGIFGMVWCTAYNFVPFGGELARERTYIIILVTTSIISLSLMTKYNNSVSIRILLDLPPNSSSQEPVQTTTETTNKNKTSNEKSFEEKYVKDIVFFIILFGLIGFNYRNYQVPDPNINVEAEGKGQFSAAIWTYHFGYDNKGWPSFERAAQVLNNTGADVITLLESDASKPYLGNNDIAMWLGERLGMFADFGPSTRDHTWGTMLLSKYPIVHSEHHLLPSPHGELAPAISATININGNLVDFVVTHMGNDRDDLDRTLQAEKLAELSVQSKNPVVFLGYVTSAPGSRDYRRLLDNGKLHDIDPTDTDRWCEYIMYRDLKRIGYARISHSGLSDTEIQMAKWQFFNGEEPEMDNDELITADEDVDESVKFNDIFGKKYHGHWSGKSHHFHMGTPKYFRPT